MKKKEQKNLIYKGTHQSFSIKNEVLQEGAKEGTQKGQKVFRSAFNQVSTR